MKIGLANNTLGTGNKKFCNSATGSEFSALEIQQMFAKITDEGRGLTKWEEGFIEDISDQFDRTQNLTEPQLIRLEQIYAQKTP